jgi:hypothetical protein
VSAALAGGYWALPREELDAASWGDRTADERLREVRALIAAAAVDTAIDVQAPDLPEVADVAGIVEAQLRGAGFDVRIELMPLVRWFFNYRRGEFQATLISHPPSDTPDAALRLHHSGGAGNPFGFRDAAIDAAIERTWGEEDRTARRETVLDVQRSLLEMRPQAHLFARRAYSAVRPYVRDSGLELPASLARYHYLQSLDLPARARGGGR